MDNRQTTRFVQLRKALIEREFTSLNPMQRQAVLTTEGPLLLLAGVFFAVRRAVRYEIRMEN